VTANFNLEDHEAQAGPYTELMGAYAGEPAGQSIVEGGVIPYKPEALARRKQNFENRMKADLSNDERWHDLGDPEMKCYMPGIPRATYLPHPFQIVQGEGDLILFSYSFANANRPVFMNPEDHLIAPVDLWMGHSNGSWDGDTLVIDTVGFNDRTWFDFAGHPHSDQLHTVERYTRTNFATMEVETTIIDPVAYEKPFAVKFTATLHEDWDLMEYICNENNQYGSAGNFQPGSGK